MGLIAIGDIHGCAVTLDHLLARLAPTPDDHLVFVGDYVDRGPDSRGVLDRLVAMQKAAEAGDGPRCTFLRGNHDQMMLDYVDEGRFDLWRVNGGLSTLSGYVDADRLAIPAEHLDFLRATELVFETDDYVFVHAGLRPQITVAENLRTGSADVYLWERSHLVAEHLVWEKTVVCGHTPQTEPLSRPLLIDIDTGCCYHDRPGFGTLTAVRLPERQFVQVPFAG